jgi:hypothetical protein
MTDTPEKPPIHQVAMELRETMDDLLPEGVGVTINTSEEANGAGSINLTISSWPNDMFMLNRDRVIAERQAVLEGRRADFSHLPFLSIEANHLAEILQTLVNRRFPPTTDNTTGSSTWPVVGEVVFDQHALDRERLSIIHSLKNAV